MFYIYINKSVICIVCFINESLTFWTLPDIYSNDIAEIFITFLTI